MAENTPGTTFSDNPQDANSRVDAASLHKLVKDATIRNIGAKAVGAGHLDGTVAGAGLKGGDGAALAVNPDNATIEVVDDALQVKDKSITDAKLHADLLARIEALEDKPEPWPVGSYFYTHDGTFVPAETFGGTWEAIRGKFLFAESDDIAAATEGGETEHTLTADEMPEHKHGLVRQGSSAYAATDQNTAGYYAGAASGYTGAAGGGAAHNNMPPFLAVYCWHRTA